MTAVTITHMTVNGRTVVGEPTRMEQMQKAIDTAYMDAMCRCPFGPEQHIDDIEAVLEPFVSGDA